MFTDWAQALEAEALPLDATPAQQRAAAARATARSSHDKDDLALLLDALGLPTDTDALTPLLPLIPNAGDAPTMTHTTTATPALSAHEAMAISMHHHGDTEQAIRQATGLSPSELSDLLTHHAHGRARAATEPAPGLPPAGRGEIQELLNWAATHPTAAVRARADRITADLAELTDRRESEAAQREAEEKVAKAKAELEKAQEELRTVRAGKAGPRTAVTTPTRSGLGSGRTREELAAIRAWARETGYQVADAGVVRKAILEAYDAAHPAPARKAG